MAIEITHVRFSGSNRFAEEIIAYQWISLENAKTASSTKPVLVDWVASGGKAYVGTGANRVGVAVVRPTGGEAYLRTHADGDWTNNLENLPLF